MKFKRSTLAFLALFSFAFFSLGNAVKAADEALSNVGTIQAPAGTSATDLRDAAYAALLGREWSVTEKTDTKVVGYLKHRDNEAQVIFTIEGSQITIQSWGYKINKAGERLKPELAKGWLENLKKDISKKLKVPYIQAK